MTATGLGFSMSLCVLAVCLQLPRIQEGYVLNCFLSGLHERLATLPRILTESAALWRVSWPSLSWWLPAQVPAAGWVQGHKARGL